MPVTIRQVPGDGNCLFHSISVSLNYVEKKKHLRMRNQSYPPHQSLTSLTSSSSSSSAAAGTAATTSTNSNSNISRDNDDDDNDYEYSARALHERSAFLRQIAVDMLTPHDDNNDNESIESNTIPNKKRVGGNISSSSSNRNSNSKSKSNSRILRKKRKAPLFLQGNEYLYRDDLLHVAASQYDLTGSEYCNLMRKDGVWGGGPEIVAISNYLGRPIHVYELVTVKPPPPRRRPLLSIPQPRAVVSVSGFLPRGIWMSMSSLLPSSTSSSSSSSLEGDNEKTKRQRGKGNMREEIDHHDPYATSSNYVDEDRNGVKISRLCEGSKPEFRLRRMACFGSPKYDHREPLHILSADCRFPDLKPGHEAANGNHFLAIFPPKQGGGGVDDLSSTRRMAFKVRSGATKKDERTKTKAGDMNKTHIVQRRSKIKYNCRNGNNDLKGQQSKDSSRRNRFLRLLEKERKEIDSKVQPQKYEREKTILQCLVDQWMKLTSIPCTN